MWNKENFNYHGGYLTYEGKFIARFKYRGMPITMGMFKSFLIKNFTPEEYFAIYDNGRGPAPIQILDDRGFNSVERARAKLEKRRA